MKLRFLRDQLLIPLQKVMGLIPRTPTLPILSNVHLLASASSVTLTATDLSLEIAAKADPALQIEHPGAITIPAHKLRDALNSAPKDAEITLEVKDDRATLRHGRSRTSLGTLPADDFPIREHQAFDTSLALPQAALKTLLDQTSYAMAEKDVRFYLCGSFFEITADRLRVVATDGHRLAYTNANVTTTTTRPEGPRNVLIPSRTVQEIQRLLKNPQGDVVVECGDGRIRLTTGTEGELQLNSTLIEGKFPDYLRVIPRNEIASLSLTRPSLIEALNRVAVTAPPDSKGVRLSSDNPEQLTLSTKNNHGTDESEEVLSADHSGAEIDICVNYRFLLDALNVFESEGLHISISSNNGPMLITDPDDDSHLHVVMPMRL